MSFSPLDVSFGDLMRRLALRTLAPGSAEIVALTAALVSRERGRGHPCIELSRWAEEPLGEEDAGALRLPALDTWRETLCTSGLAGDGTDPTPLVLDGEGRCYLYRYWEAERQLALRIRDLLAARPREIVREPELAGLFRRLFDTAEAHPVDWQAVAATAVLRNRLTVISGAPGTGKTTTVTRILALLAECDRKLRIELAAPTGKAAARLTESVERQSGELAVDADVRTLIRQHAKTIHRLLGYDVRFSRFRHDQDMPLACDVLVVDEASMIDLLLMNALLAAVPPHARVVLVGDKDQLASVEAGFVFGELCDAAGAGAYSASFAKSFHALSGAEVPLAPDSVGSTSSLPLRDAAVELRVGWRFRESSGIAQLANAVKRGDANAALATLERSRGGVAETAEGGVERLDLPRSAADVVTTAWDSIASVLDASTPEEALVRLARVRILCALNRGPWGVGALNFFVERALSERGLIASGRWYTGRPVIVTTNDYPLGLFNGDVGVCFPDSEQRLRAWFAAAGSARAVAPAKLPEHETAWAMTVHKSQGSEFDRIAFVMPDRDSPLLTRELVYTAITRAREHVTVFAAAGLLSAAIARRAQRVSGLAAALGS